MNKDVKDFDTWNKVKKNLQSRPIIYLTEGDIWFCSLGINVGSEQDGKHELFERPVLVLKKVTVNTFLGLPLTSQEKKGTWYVRLSTGSSAIISQVRLFDTRRLARKIDSISSNELQKVKEAFRNYI